MVTWVPHLASMGEALVQVTVRPRAGRDVTVTLRTLTDAASRTQVGRQAEIRCGRPHIRFVGDRRLS